MVGMGSQTWESPICISYPKYNWKLKTARGRDVFTLTLRDRSVGAAIFGGVGVWLRLVNPRSG